MKRVFGDAETYYSKEYTLRELTPVEYILDERWETHMWCIVEDDEPDARCYVGDEVADYMRSIKEPWMFVSHNALFDATILSLRYNVQPTILIDTMGVARALLMHLLPGGRVSLKKVASFLNLGAKGNALVNVRGQHLAEIQADPSLWLPYVAYCMQDVLLCRGIYNTLKSKFPATEHLIMDGVLKMATQPQFVCDQAKLYAHLHETQVEKANILATCGVSKEDLMSNEKLAKVLMGLGIAPPQKVSPITGKTAWAFAKTDKAFTDLQEDDNPTVQAVVAARLGVKSTLEESRTSRLLSIGAATERAYGVPLLPVPLRYSGAHTHRLSGDWGINLQNLPSRKSTALRCGLAAEPGRVVLAVDAAQIEARLTAWLARQWDLVEGFRNGEDIYSLFASDIYEYKVSKTDKLERLLGKICILALGFGMGAAKFRETVRIQALAAGFDIQLSADECERIVYLYRNKYASIKATWDWLQSAIPRIRSGECEGETFGPCSLHKGRIDLPSGLSLFYEDLQYSDGQWTFQYGGKRKFLYGGKLLENIVQALDRVFVFEAMLKIKRECWVQYGYEPVLAHQIHDELVYVPPNDKLDLLRGVALRAMSTPPAWGLDLPVSAEAKVGPSYGELVGC